MYCYQERTTPNNWTTNDMKNIWNPDVCEPMMYKKACMSKWDLHKIAFHKCCASEVLFMDLSESKTV